MVALEILYAANERVKAETNSTLIEDWYDYIEQHPELDWLKPLRDYFNWDDASAARSHRISQYRVLEGRFIIEIRRHDGQMADARQFLATRVPGQKARNHVPREVVANQEQLRLELSIATVKRCTTEISNLGFPENEALVATMREHVGRLEARLEAVLRPKKSGLRRRPKRDGEQPAA